MSLLNKDIIIFEGLDRVGKSSHINLLKEKLKENNINKVQYIHCTRTRQLF